MLHVQKENGRSGHNHACLARFPSTFYSQLNLSDEIYKISQEPCSLLIFFWPQIADQFKPMGN
jgi:hypothetical protein